MRKTEQDDSFYYVKVDGFTKFVTQDEEKAWEVYNNARELLRTGAYDEITIKSEEIPDGL